MRARETSWLVLSMLLLAGPVLGGAAERSAAADAEPQKVVRKAMDHLRQLERFQAKATIEIDMEMRGRSRSFSGKAELAVERPGRFALRHENERLGGTLVSGHEKTYYFHPPSNKYAIREAPPKLSGLLGVAEGRERQSLADTTLVLGQAGTLRLLLDPTSMKRLEESAAEATHEGTETLGGTKTHKISLTFQRPTGKELPLTLWIQANGDPWVRRMAPDLMAAMKGKAAHQDMTLRMHVNLDDWRTGAVAQDAFSFESPADATEVDSIQKAMAAEAKKQGDRQGKQQSLEGEEAPDFELKTMSGASFTLSEQKGVVVLDFWATWCGPCRKAMPDLQKFHEWGQKQDRPIAVYTVNLQEPPKKARGYWEDEGFTMPVLMDRDGAVAESYNVRGIPHTVFIANGQVVHVHSGYRADLFEMLKKKVKDL
jgi:thiol-disulfide isomerase/thioredoxin